MTKPISKSKRQLAQLLIEAGVTQFPEGANWAAQDKTNEDGVDRAVSFFGGTHKPARCTYFNYTGWRRVMPGTVFLGYDVSVQLSTLIPNWHQTVLSRDEFDQIVAETAEESLDLDQYSESVARTIPEPTTAPTLDQLLQDWRNADDYAQRQQAEADEAAAMRDERWQAVQARAGEMGVTVGRCEPVSESAMLPVQVGDEIIAKRVNSIERLEGRSGKVLDIDYTATDGPLYVKFHDDMSCWVKEWQLARP